MIAIETDRMVKVVVALAFLATVTLGINCGPKDKLVGTWSMTAGGCGNATLVLSKDGTGTISSMMGTETFKWRVQGDNLVLSGESPSSPRGEEVRLRYEFKEGVLHLTDLSNGQTAVFMRVGR